MHHTKSPVLESPKSNLIIGITGITHLKKYTPSKGPLYFLKADLSTERIYKSPLGKFAPYKLWRKFPLNIKGHRFRMEIIWILALNASGIHIEIHKNFHSVNGA